MVQTPVTHPSSTAQTDEKKSDETELAQTTPQTSEPVTQEAFVQQVPLCTISYSAHMTHHRRKSLRSTACA